jgi:predicted nucleic acid-binding protein
LATYFFDSSALAKHYHSEEGSAQVEALFREPGRRIIVSYLTVIEIRSMIAGKVKSGVLSQMEASSVADHFKADVAAGAIDVFAVPVVDCRRAEDLIARHGFAHRLRSLDALHLGVALDLRDQGLGKTIVAADVTLGEVAAKEGLLVLNLKD